MKWRSQVPRCAPAIGLLGKRVGRMRAGEQRHARAALTARAGPCVDDAGTVATRFAASVMGSAACESGNGDAGCLPQVVRIITAHSWEITSAQGSASLFTLLQKCGRVGCSKGVCEWAVTWISASGLLWGAW